MSSEQEQKKTEKEQLIFGDIKVPDNFFKSAPIPGVADGSKNFQNYTSNVTGSDPDPNNGDDPVILGQQLTNPYSLVNMQAAYWKLYGSTAPISATHLYVRFKPANTDQFSILLDNADLELQDYPMDYQVIQDGDYYQDSTIGTEEISWLYSVVSAEYVPPSGIQYEVIQQLHLSPNDDLLLERMAESLAAGGTYNIAIKEDERWINRTDIYSDTLKIANRLPVPCEIDPCGPGCPIEKCGGGTGGGTGGGFNPQIPRGMIQVQDIRTCNGTTPIVNVPVRQARVVCKRWFKIALTYTNDQGNFTVTKRFNNKVKIIVKTENNHAKVSKIRGVRFWQIMFPVKRRIGVYEQVAMANANYLFEKPNPTDQGDRELAYWAAATTHNSVIEYREYAVEFGVALPPAKLKVIVSNWAGSQGGGAAPMWNKCHMLSDELVNIAPFVAYFMAASPWITGVAAAAALINVLKTYVDVVVGYQALFDNYECRLTSANLKSIAYHEFGHASHFAAVTCEFWKTYRVRISNEIFTGPEETRPYGDGTETNAGIVALGEMWADHCGYVFTNRHYGNGGVNGGFPNGFTARMQGQDWPNEVGLNSHLNAIENHDPNFGADVHRWIPRGFPYDLIDDRNDINFFGPITDNVNVYNTQLCFAALQNDVRDISAFRDRLLLQNGNLQLNQVNALIGQYGY